MDDEFETATPQNFDERRYLLANPDLAQSLAAGSNALDHFRLFGRAEGRKQRRLAEEELELATFANFDEERYLLANPDVARVVAAGASALGHFYDYGLKEKRKQQRLNLAEQRERYRRRYERLSPLLEARHGKVGTFRPLDVEDSFPVLYGTTTFDLADYAGESANAGFAPFELEMRANPEKRYLDVGCGHRSRIEPNCLYLEVYRSASADVVMEPACRYPIATASLDGIGCFAVLEHVTEPWEVAREFARMLKPGGKIFIDWPFLQPVHGYPSHYYNATREGLRQMFEEQFDIQENQTRLNQTPDFTVNWILNALDQGLAEPTLKDRLAGMTVAELAAEEPGGAFWREIVAALDPKTVETLACGNTLIAAKRS